MEENISLRELQSHFKRVLQERGLSDTTIEKEMLMLVEEVGELAKAIRKQQGGKIDYSRASHYDTVQSEAADVLIVLIGLCNMMGIDLYDALCEKEEINKKRKWS